MDEKIDRMMLYRRICIIFFVAFCVMLTIIATLLIVMSTSDYRGGNSDFATIEDYGEAVTQKIELEKINTLYFFAEQIARERTLFTDEIPNLKIINSDKYYMEITASRSLADKLSVKNENEKLTISFEEKYYNYVTSGGKEYKGLYVDCDIFDVTVYAPITTLISSAEINLDFDAPKTETLGIAVTGEVREGKIYNIDVEALVCSFSGASTVELIGKAHTGAQLEARHNTKIEGDELITPYASTSVMCQIFGYSYIDGSSFSDYPFIDMGFLITHAVMGLLLLAAIGFVLFNYLLQKQRKELDGLIEKIEKEGNFLNIPKKTDENLLQNSH